MLTQANRIVQGVEELKDTYIRKTGRFLFFKTSWWEKVNTEHVANDIVITTDRPIRNIILNGEVIKNNN